MEQEQIYESNALIDNWDISIEHGILTCTLYFGEGAGGYVQGFGGYNLEDSAGVFIKKCMEIAGVSNWKHVIGRAVRIRRNYQTGRIVAIGHIIKDIWFYPDKDM